MSRILTAGIDYGEWQGLTPREARQPWPAQIDNWYHHPERAHIPGGGTLADLHQRAMKVIHRLAEKHTSDTIVWVGHAVFNCIILQGVLGLGNERFWHRYRSLCSRKEE